MREGSPPPTCMCQVSGVKCHMLHEHFFKGEGGKVVKLVGVGSVINGAYPFFFHYFLLLFFMKTSKECFFIHITRNQYLTSLQSQYHFFSCPEQFRKSSCWSVGRSVGLSLQKRVPTNLPTYL